MTIHLIKLCVGADTLEDVYDWQRDARARAKAVGIVDDQGEGEIWHTTRMSPKRRDEVLDGGSIFWVIKRVIQVRQRIVDLRAVRDDDGIERCQIVLHRDLVPVRGMPRRPFQGWRYLTVEDAPDDLTGGTRAAVKIPPQMARDLAELGLL